jgi:transposase
MRDLLASPRVLKDDTLYRCLDKLVAHKRAFFSFLRARWETLFDAHFDVLLYDLTSTYFESDSPFAGKRQYGYSRDKRPDCVQVVIALIVTPEGFPLAYEVMPGNTSDNTTLTEFLERIEQQYGRSDRVWIMDRGIPTEATLKQMRARESPVHYLVGTPKGRLTQLEREFLAMPWHEVREHVDVKLLDKDEELYILARSRARTLKERGMRRRRLKKLWRRLHELQQQKLTRDQLLIKLGAAKKEAGRAYQLVHINLPEQDQAVTPTTFSFSLRRDKLRIVRRREGRYLLRSNLRGEDPATLWQYYIQLTEIEQAFKELKHDLAIRPIFHQTDERIEAHIFIAFIAYCLHVTLKHQTRSSAPGLTPRAVLEKFATIQMVDVHLPTTDGRHLVLSRYTQPNKDHQLLLQQLKLRLPAQPPPRISA